MRQPEGIRQCRAGHHRQVHLQATQHRPSAPGHRRSQGNRPVGRERVGVQAIRRLRGARRAGQSFSGCHAKSLC